MRILESKHQPIKKIIFETTGTQFYYTVSFYSPEQNSIIVCASSQIGCSDNCSFCATGHFPYIKNLSYEQMKEQYLLGVEIMNDFLLEKNVKSLCIILEGMGEASYNIGNTLIAFKDVYAELSAKFNQIVFKISSAGNTQFIQDFKSFVVDNSETLARANFYCQLSLHTPFKHERDWLMPSVSKNVLIPHLIHEFCALSDFLQKKLICNYMLLNFPQGGCNYTQEHLYELLRLLDPLKVEIKLTRYSETNRGFSSPENQTFYMVKQFFEGHGFKTKFKELLGDDISAACGMLHYK